MTNQTLQKINYGIIKRNFSYITSPIRILPSFIVIGAGRSATTTLHYNLSKHPCLFSAAYDEIGFFDSNYELGINWYKSMFPTKFLKNRIIKNHEYFMTYEVTPSYIRKPWIAERIKKTLPDVQLIAILRNPVDRAYSHYWMGIQAGYEKRSFEEIIEDDIAQIENNLQTQPIDDFFKKTVENSYLARGLYEEQLKIWFEIFPKNQILVISTEELAVVPQTVLSKIFAFLNVSDYEISFLEKKQKGEYPPMEQINRNKLLNFFKPYNEKLFSLIGTRFDWDK